MSAREPIVLLVVGAALLVWSGVAPADRTTWILEVFPIFIAAPLLYYVQPNRRAIARTAETEEAGAERASR